MALAAGLQGAFSLARGRSEGIGQVAAGRDAARLSFWAMALCLPAFLFLRVTDWAWNGMPPHLGHATALELLAYATGWLAFAVASRPLAALLGRERRWELFVAVWNWCNVIQYLLLVAAAIPRLLGAPDWVCQTAGLVALGWALWLEWYGTRLALDVGGWTATGMVMVDAGIGIAMSAAIGLLS